MNIEGKKSRYIFGLVILLIGILFALKNIFNIDLLKVISWNMVWPVLLIIWAVSILVRK